MTNDSEEWSDNTICDGCGKSVPTDEAFWHSVVEALCGDCFAATEPASGTHK